jgi:hypothetical protein
MCVQGYFCPICLACDNSEAVSVIIENTLSAGGREQEEGWWSPSPFLFLRGIK